MNSFFLRFHKEKFFPIFIFLFGKQKKKCTLRKFKTTNKQNGVKNNQPTSEDGTEVQCKKIKTNQIVKVARSRKKYIYKK